MLNRRYPVLISGKRYSPEFQTDKQYAKSWKVVLERAYGTHAICQCPSSGSRKLSIKRREDSDGFHLARFAGTGHEHSNDCRYYAPAPERSGMQGYAVGVVEEGEDGSIRVRLARGIRVQAPRSEESDGASVTRSPGKSKPAMTLLGLLHLLWSESRLSTWYPAMEGKRNSSIVNYALLQAAERVAASRMKLNEVLLLAAQRDSKGAARNQAITKSAITRDLRLVAISPLARYNPERHSGDIGRLPLSGPFGMPILHLPPAVWATAARKFERELSAWRRGSRVIAIAQVTPRKGESLSQGDVVELALMQVSERWIPVDSDYEGVIEAKLHAAGRSFDKPLRYDADESEVFPDFWLLDAGKDYPLEVFGMNTPAYLERKAVKTAWYNREYGGEGWWSWDAAADPKGKNIPPFPPRA
ncbi:TPA: DUF1173 family protein [Pseudomonas aeruginosa]|uniref:DUF1173 family protein n=1 Tax=Pseudomonas aeruginosa TaxID=287 RepID=UPI002A6B3D30|nr:DUF1173 family protein [Pseudomonas aeruginosa]MDY1103158.1 DUF1173 family protein [Pseudomonas aeruginosa]HCH7473829.1 DUF1173 family protein [Pseudomonas aeruginosa]HCH7803265.1 DUF1173 family protein [Pseudomonas aeruginosa]HCI4168664.1 DUF1173 family protein [Pseudomonas aeruginosa]HCI7165069.1 DUF1173 family protein [Pseudomonas aeruginosa]